MTSTTITWESETVPIAGAALHVARAGAGAPLLVLHHDVGSLERLPFYDALARRFTVIVPSHPGYDRSERPDWLRSVRDVAVLYQWLLAQRALHRDPGRVMLLGLGFSGLIHAELRSVATRASRD